MNRSRSVTAAPSAIAMNGSPIRFCESVYDTPSQPAASARWAIDSGEARLGDALGEQLEHHTRLPANRSRCGGVRVRDDGRGRGVKGHHLALGGVIGRPAGITGLEEAHPCAVDVVGQLLRRAFAGDYPDRGRTEDVEREGDVETVNRTEPSGRHPLELVGVGCRASRASATRTAGTRNAASVMAWPNTPAGVSAPSAAR